MTVTIPPFFTYIENNICFIILVLPFSSVQSLRILKLSFPVVQLYLTQHLLAVNYQHLLLGEFKTSCWVVGQCVLIRTPPAPKFFKIDLNVERQTKTVFQNAIALALTRINHVSYRIVHTRLLTSPVPAVLYLKGVGSQPHKLCNN